MAVLAMTPEVRELRERARGSWTGSSTPTRRCWTARTTRPRRWSRSCGPRCRAAGLWAPHIGPEAGGSGRGFVAYAFLNELIGRSAWAPLVFGCQAPDAGNAEILHLFGTPAQRERWLRPLVAGDIRSFFSMTEPEVSGSDPTGLRTTAVRHGDDWVIDGHKWFSSGAEGADFGIVMAVTDPGAEPHRRMSQIIVPATTPGVELVRAIPVMGHRGRGWSTHCEVRYHGVRVPVANTIGEPGDGFRIAQKRLGPGRIHHVMRWLGQMQRAFELMCGYALGRQAFGGPLAGKQTVQNWVADSAAEIQACRLLTLDAAARIDAGGRGQGGDLGGQVLRRPGAARRDRPGGPDPRGPRPDRPDAAGPDVRRRQGGPVLRRPRRGPPHGGEPPGPAGVRAGRGLGLRRRRPPPMPASRPRPGCPVRLLRH